MILKEALKHIWTYRYRAWAAKALQLIRRIPNIKNDWHAVLLAIVVFAQDRPATGSAETQNATIS